MRGLFFLCGYVVRVPRRPRTTVCNCDPGRIRTETYAVLILYRPIVCRRFRRRA